MRKALKLRTFQIGSPRKRGEGIRVGTVRFLPRGVLKKDYALNRAARKLCLRVPSSLRSSAAG
jgi:uncharacterized protein YeaO (DUF488 family)